MPNPHKPNPWFISPFQRETLALRHDQLRSMAGRPTEATLHCANETCIRAALAALGRNKNIASLAKRWLLGPGAAPCCPTPVKGGTPACIPIGAPAATFANPEGFESDLSENRDGLEVRVIVVPWVGRRSSE